MEARKLDTTEWMVTDRSTNRVPNGKPKDKKRVRKYILAWYIGIAVFIVGLNILAWHSTAFCDWYIANIFPIWLNTYGRITGLFPFSVGEWLLVAGIILVGEAVLLAIVWAVITVVQLIRRWAERGSVPSFGKISKPAPSLVVSEKPADKMIYTQFRKVTGRFYHFFAWTLLGVCLIMTLNCFILYHASTFSEHYFGEDNGEYELTELITLYNMVAEKCNYYAGMIERDENGVPVYRGTIGEDGECMDMADTARAMMQKLGETYPQLDGYYPRPKPLIFSDFMCQQYMCGYYFPFSLEANYNDVMYELNFPATMCHELAHLRGYIYEDEANFISYLACVQSEDIYFQYAGYISVLVYLNNDLYKAWQQSRTAYEAAIAQVSPVGVLDQVWVDNTFVTQEEWDRINGKALIDTEVVEEAADVFVDTNLKVNGVTDGAVSYSRVVKLLLQYYRHHGWGAE